MSKITYIKISGKTEEFILDKKEINCIPAAALKPCVPEDQFSELESCRVCGKMF
ncbi:hypothetical protein ACFS5M_12545 [Lacinutrix iliipiscaria]|uniref:Uncharacterized protein n=1 Tax=Lacinutrix iliipiscaria TaxID=1230532 RepID=A0ABW5WP19_9FLAO